ncbi:chitin-binding protein [Lentzea fradiae]|uniref:Chitin-binding protein n=1 Tax=Lentzea fradiae TaxID=200378 RepID=A0A1G7QBD8_9PSEU|nr:lytic polysaccharide monooxygenase [Lentzea fradiae]SDF95804.1 chitin-binding protein [Lentzea fradiae]
MKFTRKAALVLAAVPAIVVISPVGSASAHGYVSSPPSRSAQCALKTVPCGAPTFEPQSSEGPKGMMNCNGARGDFEELNDDNKNWQVTSTGTSLTIGWTFTARHKTSNYEYFINGTRVGFVDGGNAAPSGSVRHTIDLSGFSGRQKIFAVWNIADTGNAFYNCIDVNINGGGGGGTTTPPPTSTTTKPPAPTSEPTRPNPTQPTQQPGGGGGSWAPNVAYATGSQVTFGGATYRCRQGHTTLTGWEPPIVPALWERV